MEQTINQFSKGLQLDTNPMVQSNDTLSDALNGTFITMNGNEVVLQNDMGNRRVNNAYLPAGYEPVGMKEYGGIIYIAAYNPITNQSQIGSFPSPQKRFSDIENGGILNLEYFLNDAGNIFREEFNFSNGSKVFLQFAKSDTQFVPLTEDSAIYPGDKFTVYSAYINEKGKDLITNYYNIEGDKIITPKNKDYTLYLGVLNSQNEFMDITPTLQRWELNTETNKYEIINFQKKYNYTVSDNFKFNSGYFIPADFSNNKLEETIQDANFIRVRQALPINTYSSKLAGPLYLKAYFNHVQDFEYNIIGYQFESGGEQYVSLTIEGFFTYNCQDKNDEENYSPSEWKIIDTGNEGGDFSSESDNTTFTYV